jgi:hypothetical protein
MDLFCLQHDSDACGCYARAAPAAQSLDELAFTRSACYAAQLGQVGWQAVVLRAWGARTRLALDGSHASRLCAWAAIRWPPPLRRPQRQVEKLARLLAANPQAVHWDGGGSGSSSGYTPLHYAARWDGALPSRSPREGITGRPGGTPNPVGAGSGCSGACTSAHAAAAVVGAAEPWGHPGGGGLDNRRSGDGACCPPLACGRAGHVDCVRLLLQSGAAVDAATKGGGTSLHRAAFAGHLEVVELL